MATDRARQGRLDRRAVLLGLASVAALPPIPLRATTDAPRFVACGKRRDGSFAAIVLDHEARMLHAEALDARGHDAAIAPDGRLAVIFARRPGRFALALDLDRLRRVTAFAPPADRHFYGHGFFSPDGRLLYATENDFEAERGVLGIYDVAAGFTRLGEIDTGGIGPHEALLMSDGRTIAIANGGIATHPDFPRQKLNLADMAPSLVYLDAKTGDLIERVALGTDLRRLSLRHLAEAGDGSIWLGGQYEGPESDRVALVGRHAQGRDLALIAAPDSLYQGMNHYVGSVAASRDGGRIATTSPRGGRVIIWDAATREPTAIRDLPDVCGAAPSGTGFAFSDGLGQLHHADGVARSDAIAAWDNHLRTV